MIGIANTIFRTIKKISTTISTVWNDSLTWNDSSSWTE
jgi:hypothetical protein